MIFSHALNITTNALAVDNAIHCSVSLKEKNDIRREMLATSAAIGLVVSLTSIFQGQIIIPFKAIEFSCVVIYLGANAYCAAKKFNKEQGISLITTAISIARLGWELSKYPLALEANLCHFDKVWMVLSGLEITGRLLGISLREQLT